MTNDVIQIAVPSEITESLKLLTAGGATAIALKWKTVLEVLRRGFGKKYSVHLCERLNRVEERLNKLEEKK